MSSLVRWQWLAQPRHTQTHSLCLSAEELSAVAPAKQVYSIMTATLLRGWRVAACMWDLFFFLHEDAVKLFPKCQLFKNYAKQIYKRIHEPRSPHSQRRRKLVSTCQQKYSIHFYPLTVILNKFVCLPCLFVVPPSFTAATEKYTFYWSSGNRAVFIMNLIIPRPKWRSLLQSSLGRG